MKSLAQEWMDEGMQAGMQRGIQAGIYQREHEIAKNMLVKGFDLSTISEITGLSLSKINRLRNEPN